MKFGQPSVSCVPAGIPERSRLPGHVEAPVGAVDLGVAAERLGHAEAVEALAADHLPAGAQVGHDVQVGVHVAEHRAVALAAAGDASLRAERRFGIALAATPALESEAGLAVDREQPAGGARAEPEDAATAASRRPLGRLADGLRPSDVAPLRRR